MITSQVLGPAMAVTSALLMLQSGYEAAITLTNAGKVTGAGVLSEPVRAGDEALVEWVIHKQTDCPGWNSRVWNGQNGFHLTEEKMPTTLPRTSSAREYIIPTKVPGYAPPGELSLTIVGEYICPGHDPYPFNLGPVSIEVLG